MRQIFVSRIYNILNLLSTKQINNGYHSLEQAIPVAFLQSGLYFFVDPSIPRTNGGGFKIVRIGITGNNGNNRLQLHKNGSITNSVFRKHIGHALMVQNNAAINEIHISNYIQQLKYVFLPVEDQVHLKMLEKSLIEIISNCNQLNNIDIPGANWLGIQIGPNINNAIACSHLWNVHHVRNYNANNNANYNQSINDFNILVNALL
jgi:hypothetical protein